MPTKKIAELPKPCRHPEHDPPKYMVYEEGVYEHTCPACERVVRFVVRKPRLGPLRRGPAVERAPYYAMGTGAEWPGLR